MLNEETLRRSEFRRGKPIRLADGQFWMLPTPSDDRPAIVDADLDATLRGVREAEDWNERLRAELALAVHLLSRNYRLGPAEFRDLLEFQAEGPALTEARKAFRLLAMEHLRACRPIDDAETRTDWSGAGSWRPLTSALNWLLGRRAAAGPIDPIRGHHP